MKKHNLDLDWFEDADRDGIPNLVDCAPFDNTKDGFLGRALNTVTRGKKGQSKEEYEEEKEKKRKHKLEQLGKKTEYLKTKLAHKTELAQAKGRLKKAKIELKGESKGSQFVKNALDKLEQMKAQAMKDKANQIEQPKQKTQDILFGGGESEHKQNPQMNFDDMLDGGFGGNNNAGFDDMIGFGRLKKKKGKSKKSRDIDFNKMIGGF